MSSRASTEEGSSSISRLSAPRQLTVHLHALVTAQPRTQHSDDGGDGGMVTAVPYLQLYRLPNPKSHAAHCDEGSRMVADGA